MLAAKGSDASEVIWMSLGGGLSEWDPPGAPLALGGVWGPQPGSWLLGLRAPPATLAWPSLHVNVKPVRLPSVLPPT